MFQDALNDSYDIAIIVSGDSDLIPAIEAAKSQFPDKQYGVVIPYNRKAEEIKHAADFHIKMKERHLDSCRFPESIPLPDGRTITCPASWK